MVLEKKYCDAILDTCLGKFSHSKNIINNASQDRATFNKFEEKITNLKKELDEFSFDCINKMSRHFSRILSEMFSEIQNIAGHLEGLDDGQRIRNLYHECNQKISLILDSIRAIKKEYYYTQYINIENWENEIIKEKDSINEKVNKIQLMYSQVHEYLDRIKTVDSSIATTLDEKQREIDEKIQNIQDEFQKKHDTTTASIKNKLEKILEEAQEKLDSISVIHTLISKEATKTKFGEISLKEGETAKNFRRWAIVLFIIEIIAASCYFAFTMQNNVSANTMLASLSIGLLNLTFIAYLIKQSANHRVIAYWARQMELEIETFEPFISNYDDKLKNELRAKSTEKIFGSFPSHLNQTNNELIVLAAMEKLASQIAKK